jgi:hypothetical protein
MSRDEVILAKQRFAERVPKHYYSLRGDPFVSCDGGICKAKGIMQAFGGGAELYEYEIRRTPTYYEILLERSAAITRPDLAKAPGKPSPTVKRDPCAVDQWVCRALREKASK